MGKVVAFYLYVLFDEAIYVIGRAKARELEKFADKVGLIEVPAIQGQGRPIERKILMHESSVSFVAGR